MHIVPRGLMVSAIASTSVTPAPSMLPVVDKKDTIEDDCFLEYPNETKPPSERKWPAQEAALTYSMVNTALRVPYDDDADVQLLMKHISRARRKLEE